MSFRLDIISPDIDDNSPYRNLLQTVFPDFKTFSDEWWQWKYQDSAFGKAILVTAYDESDDTLAGFRAFWRWVFIRDGQAILAVQPCDTAVLANYRRRGLFSQMTNLAQEHAANDGIPLIFNFPNFNSKPAYLKLGWQDLGGLSRYIRVINYPKAVLNFALWRGKMRPLHAETAAQPMAMLPDSIDRLVEGSMSHHHTAITTARSYEYFKWRYEQSPLFPYGYVAYPDAANATVLLIYTVGYRGLLRDVQIVDIVARPGDAPSFRQAIKQLIAIEKPTWITVAVSNGFHLQDLLKSAGFINTKRLACNSVGKLSAAANADDYELGDLSLIHGDVDIL